ncbi:hypothetical protein B0T25DRAFT_583187 [Lasiosphaeria hispida]|uniref:Uncharacterized protein n=1 Tax=Lasiosphaeria hispida TaxID=260671 RepID=A0AAJ0HA85_9PEZI|nr:hypothetical protein B0T25DRAFT_583187 [Lasiosphaeria hispida]
MAPPRTYLLPPTFDMPSIPLGNLLANPFTPLRVLTVLPAHHHPPTTTTVQTNLSITRTAGRGASASLSAQLLALVGLRLSAEVSTTASTTYSAARVTTQSFAGDPDAAAIHKAITESPRASRVIGEWGGRLFLVTGVKVAEGFTVAREAGVRMGVGLGGGGPVVPGLDVGGEVGGLRERGEAEGYGVEGEVVIGYKVLVVRRKGWKGEDMELEDYRTRNEGRMLGDTSDSDEELGVDVTELLAEDLGTADEQLHVKRDIVDSEEGQVVVLAWHDGSSNLGNEGRGRTL